MLTIHGFHEFVEEYSARLQSLSGLLNLLDNRIGDGDHGTNMARGFQAGNEKLQQAGPGDLGTACSTLAMALISTVGGASGPLYGTVFLKLSATWKGLATACDDALLQGLSLALEGIQTRGKAIPGDKTMVDVWYAVTSHLQQVNPRSDEDWNRGVQIAQEAALKTKDWVAKRGRASYLGGRSAGVCDPGCISSAVLFEELFHKLTGGASRLEWETLALY